MPSFGGGGGGSFELGVARLPTGGGQLRGLAGGGGGALELTAGGGCFELTAGGVAVEDAARAGPSSDCCPS